MHKQVDAASCPRSTLPAGCWRAVHGKLCIRLSKATAPGRCWRKAWRRRARWGSCWPCAAPSRKAPAGAPSPGPRPCSALGDRSLCHTGGPPRSHPTLLLTLGAYRRASLRLTHPCDSIQTACSLHLEHTHMWGRLGCRAFRRAQAAHERGGGGGCACGRRGGACITLWQAAVPHCRLPGVHCAPAAAADSARKVACAKRAPCCDSKSDVPAVHPGSSASICSPRPAPSAPGSLRGQVPVHARRLPVHSRSLCMPDAKVVGCHAGRAGVTAGSCWMAGGDRPAAADAAHSAAESSSMPRSVEPGPWHADGGPGRPASYPGSGRCTDGPGAARAGRRGGAATRRGAARAPGAAGGRGGASIHHGWRAQVVLICPALHKRKANVVA